MRKSLVWVVVVLSSQLACCCFDFEGGGGGGDGYGDPSVRTPLPATLAGEWRDPYNLHQPGSTLLIYDVEKGTWMANDVSDQRAGTGFFFYADGRYLRSSYSTLTNPALGCVNRFWSYEQGSVSLSGTTLTLHPAIHRQKADQCADSGDTEGNVSLEAVSYTWSVQAESDNATYLYLQGNQQNLRYVRLTQ